MRLKALGLCPPEAIAAPVISTLPEWKEFSLDERARSARAMEVYAAMVDRINWNVGRWTSHLKRTGIFEDTVIVFMSDNGAEGQIVEALPIIGGPIARMISRTCDNRVDNIGRANSFVWYGGRWAQAATAPSRLYKMFTTQGGIRVPVIWHHPRTERQGEIANAFSTVMDILPTFLERRCATVHDDDTATGWELHGRRAIRKGTWKAVSLAYPGVREPWKLYDLSVDPGETHDLAQAHPGKLSELLSEWDRYVRETSVFLEPLTLFDAEAGVFVDQQTFASRRRAELYGKAPQASASVILDPPGSR